MRNYLMYKNKRRNNKFSIEFLLPFFATFCYHRHCHFLILTFTFHFLGKKVLMIFFLFLQFFSQIWQQNANYLFFGLDLFSPPKLYNTLFGRPLLRKKRGNLLKCLHSPSYGFRQSVGYDLTSERPDHSDAGPASTP